MRRSFFVFNQVKWGIIVDGTKTKWRSNETVLNVFKPAIYREVQSNMTNKSKKNK